MGSEESEPRLSCLCGTHFTNGVASRLFLLPSSYTEWVILLLEEEKKGRREKGGKTRQKQAHAASRFMGCFGNGLSGEASRTSLFTGHIHGNLSEMFPPKRPGKGSFCFFTPWSDLNITHPGLTRPRGSLSSMLYPLEHLPAVRCARTGQRALKGQSAILSALFTLSCKLFQSGPPTPVQISRALG